MFFSKSEIDFQCLKLFLKTQYPTKRNLVYCLGYYIDFFRYYQRHHFIKPILEEIKDEHQTTQITTLLSSLPSKAVIRSIVPDFSSPEISTKYLHPYFFSLAIPMVLAGPLGIWMGATGSVIPAIMIVIMVLSSIMFCLIYGLHHNELYNIYEHLTDRRIDVKPIINQLQKAHGELISNTLSSLGKEKHLPLEVLMNVSSYLSRHELINRLLQTGEEKTACLLSKPNELSGLFCSSKQITINYSRRNL